MKTIAITQRVTISEKNERSDMLDSRWIDLMTFCGLTPLILPNEIDVSKKIILNSSIDGILLTGGNTLKKYGGNAANRDNLEYFLIDFCLKNKKPLLGVCRGMQIIQDWHEIPLEKISDHVTPKQWITIHNNKELVNSYHEWGTKNSNDSLKVWARADDGVIKAIQVIDKPVYGIMWHPERIDPFRQEDIQFIKKIFL